MTYSLRCILITLAVLGAGSSAQALTPRIAMLATAQSFGLDHETSPVAAAGPECQGCCESSHWLHQLVQHVPYLNRMFAPPKGIVVVTKVNRAKVNLERKALEAQHVQSVAEFARSNTSSTVAPPTTWSIQLVGRKVAVTSGAPSCSAACCGTGAAIAGSATPSCGSCGVAPVTWGNVTWPVPSAARAVPTTSPYYVPDGGTVHSGARVVESTVQACPTAPRVAPVPIRMQSTNGPFTTFGFPIANDGALNILRNSPAAPPQVHAQMVQAATTTTIPNAPPALKMQASQVQLSTSQMELSADRMQHVGDDVLLEGNVRIVLKRGSGEPVRVTASRVVVNLRDNSFRVGQATPAPAPAMPVSSFGVERIIYQIQPTPVAPPQPAGYEGGVRYYVLPVQSTIPTPAYPAPPVAMPVPMPSLRK